MYQEPENNDRFIKRFKDPPGRRKVEGYYALENVLQLRIEPILTPSNFEKEIFNPNGVDALLAACLISDQFWLCDSLPLFAEVPFLPSLRLSSFLVNRRTYPSQQHIRGNNDAPLNRSRSSGADIRLIL